MNKNCTRCSKIVYPIEEFKCLDKTWHKTCFKCTECNMALNMKTYKGFNKYPYCEAHIPKAKATTIAETPETKRIAENTKIQSNVKYHADFEKAKGKLTQVADDPETLRIKQNTKNISNAAYHGDIQKKAAMERQRELTEIVDSKDNNESEYFSERLAAESLPHYQPPSQPTASIQQSQQISPTTSPYNSIDSINNQANNNNNHHQYTTSQATNQTQSSHSINNKYQQQQPQQPNYINNNHVNVQQQLPVNGTGVATAVPQLVRNNVVQSSAQPSGGNGAGGGISNNQQMQQALQQKYYDQYENYARPNPAATNSNGVNNNNNTNGNVVNGNGYTKGYPVAQQQQQQQPQMQSYTPQQQQQMAYNNHYNQQNGVGSVGKIADYDPVTDGPRNVPQTVRQNQTLIYSSDRATIQAQQQQQQQQRRIGSVNDMDPVNGYYSSGADQYQQQNFQKEQQRLQQQQQQYLQQQQRLKQQQLQQQQQQQQQLQQQLQQQQQQQYIQQQPKSVSKVRVYRALYDYEAQDSDEVSFAEGDLVFEVNSIDAGWMTGRVERTGQTGMLPANYVEIAMI